MRELSREKTQGCRMTREERYIRRRLRRARRQARAFYECRRFPIQPKKIVFTTIEGTTGFSCHPKYIALELLRRNREEQMGLDLVWLVDDVEKQFPLGIRKVRNTLRNRAYELSTAQVWVDNSRKQLEVRKRPGQFYLQVWHGMIGFKPIGRMRGASFSRIAYLVSKHDADMVDAELTDSDWFSKIIPDGLLYDGPLLKFGAPRCDILHGDRSAARRAVRERFGFPADANIILYAPTFRGGSQGTQREVKKVDCAPDAQRLLAALRERFGGDWYLFLRLHPQLVARHMEAAAHGGRIVDVSHVDDVYEILAGCDAFLTDYSSLAFDAIHMRIPIFIYASDIDAYEKERGKLLWDMDNLPFPWAKTDDGLAAIIHGFQSGKYQETLDRFFQDTQMVIDGRATERTVDFLLKKMRGFQQGSERSR